VETAPGTGYQKPRPELLEADEIPGPAVPSLNRPFHVYMPGVGGTGVLTANGMLSVAAALDGNRMLSYDQTGAAQKWDPVISSLVIAPPGAEVHSSKVGMGRADLYLALDVHVTIDEAGLRAAITAQSRATVTVPARRIAEELFGDYMLTNIVALGAAYQAGLLPLSASAIERAIELNGVAVKANLQAFRYGRLWVHDMSRVAGAMAPPQLSADEEYPARRTRLDRRRRAAADRLWARADGLAEQTRQLLGVRLPELLGYQGEDYARRYLDAVLAAARREEETLAGAHELTDAVARNLYKLMAYKDEYEVARLFLKPSFATEIAATFAKPARVVNHLQPPLARRAGRNRKIAVGPWFRPAFRVLRMARRLRATPLDPFARQASRVEERALIAWYQALVAEVLAELRPSNYAVAVELAELPDLIRGYEQVKHAGAESAQARAAELLEQLHRPRLPLMTTGAP
jgi:indolepyruvate ferredoxin oxidoreductase